MALSTYLLPSLPKIMTNKGDKLSPTKKKKKEIYKALWECLLPIITEARNTILYILAIPQ